MFLRNGEVVRGLIVHWKYKKQGNAKKLSTVKWRHLCPNEEYFNLKVIDTECGTKREIKSNKLSRNGKKRSLI